MRAQEIFWSVCSLFFIFSFSYCVGMAMGWGILGFTTGGAVMVSLLWARDIVKEGTGGD